MPGIIYLIRLSSLFLASTCMSTFECDAPGIRSGEPLRGRPDVSSLQSLCFHAQRCDRARGQLGEGRDAHRERFRDFPTHVRCAAAGRAQICRCACQHRPLPPDVLRLPQHAGRPCAGLLRARLVRQSEYASKGSTIIATWCSCSATQTEPALSHKPPSG